MISLQSLVLIAALYVTVGALVAQFTIQTVARFKPPYPVVLIAGVVRLGASYLAGVVITWIMTSLRLNFTKPMLAAMIVLQIALQAASYALIVRGPDRKRLRFGQACVTVLCVLGVGVSVGLIWAIGHHGRGTSFETVRVQNPVLLVALELNS